MEIYKSVLFINCMLHYSFSYFNKLIMYITENEIFESINIKNTEVEILSVIGNFVGSILTFKNVVNARTSSNHLIKKQLHFLQLHILYDYATVIDNTKNCSSFQFPFHYTAPRWINPEH